VGAVDAQIAALNCHTLVFFGEIKFALILRINPALGIVGHSCDYSDFVAALD
jgi:hypothetical protein